MLYTHKKCFALQRKRLVQILMHWLIFLNTASRRSRVRVSVPVWGITLSRPLSIVAMVSRYLTIQLIERTPISNRQNFNYKIMQLCSIMRDYSPFPVTFPLLEASCVRVTHLCATRQHSAEPVTVRLAYIKLPSGIYLYQYIYPFLVYRYNS